MLLDVMQIVGIGVTRIQSSERDKFDEVVHSVHWQCAISLSSADDGHTAS